MLQRLVLAVPLALAIAQEPAPLRVSVTLVQVDAVVTGRGGGPVTDLTKDDFLLLEDGKPRAITHASYVDAGPAGAGAGMESRARTTKPATPARREGVRRTIAFLVDDLGMSFESMHSARVALHKFVREQMTPGDLVAVMSTSGGIGMLQQFTTDSRQLDSAIDRLRFRLAGKPNAAVPPLASVATAAGAAEAMSANIMTRLFAVGTLGAIRHIVEGLQDMPGRKSLILFSDGFFIRSKDRKEPPVTVGEVQSVAERANRASVVISTVDARGLFVPGLQAQDDVSNMEQEEVRTMLEDRMKRFRDNQEGLQFLAAETGGTSLFDDNDLNAGVSKSLREQSGYYLLGFQPSEEELALIRKDDRPRRLILRVKRPGVRVRYRKTYLGPSGPDGREPGTPQERLLAALHSPFAGNGLGLRFTPMFMLDDKGQAGIRALLHIDGSGVEFSADGPNGMRTAKLHIVAVTEGELPARSAVTERSYTVEATPAEAGQLEKGGFVYTFLHRAGKPGPYHMRVAVLDEHSGLIGSASQFVEVPNVSKGVFALSSVTMCEGDWRPGRQEQLEQQSGGPLLSDLSPAIRVF
ncbi:MAG: VWA domain-containing protein, partial [Acidobacteriota bacterium]